jgi:peptidoglycan/LPS O-acetylase OafA/YrhL
LSSPSTIRFFLRRKLSCGTLQALPIFRDRFSLDKSFIRSNQRLPGLDLLRAIAILWVMLFHARGLNLPFYPVARFGWMGVDLFFVLSGFLIGSQLLKPYLEGKRPSLGLFYLRRAFRILPVYWVVLLLYFAVPMVREQPDISPLWEFLTFTENLFLNLSGVLSFTHVWSLCVEEHFYLVLPLLTLWLMRRPSARKTLWLCAAILIGGIAIRAYFWHHLKPLQGMDDDGFTVQYFERIYYPTYARLDGLLVGVALASLRSFRPVLWERCMRGGNALLACGVGMMGLSIWLFRHGMFHAVATIIGFPLLAVSIGVLVGGALSEHGPIGRIKVWGSGTVAALSYSLYLSHKIVLHLDGIYLARYVGDGGYRALGIYGVTTFGAAGVLYWLVERPFLYLRNRLEKRRGASIRVEILEEPAI